VIELLSGPVGPIVIFFLRIGDVSLGTIRLVLVTRGARLPAALLGVAEVLIWITAVGSAILNLTSPWHVIGYATGFGAGTWVGMWLEERVPLGTALVQATCRGSDTGVAEALRDMGFGVTEVVGEGFGGPVEVVSTVVKRQSVPRVIARVEATDPDAFIAVFDARVRRGLIPGSLRK
jgi:uncharacterized protein YebE (UPF0316 family)